MGRVPNAQANDFNWDPQGFQFPKNSVRSVSEITAHSNQRRSMVDRSLKAASSPRHQFKTGNDERYLYPFWMLQKVCNVAQSRPFQTIF